MTNPKNFFKPGNKLGSGRPKLPPEVRAFKELSFEQFIYSLQRYGNYKLPELEALLESNTLSSFDHMFCDIVYKAASGDDYNRQLLIDRLWGKVKEDIDFRIHIKALPQAELIELGKKALKVLQGETNETTEEASQKSITSQETIEIKAD